MSHILITNRRGKTSRFHMGGLWWAVIILMFVGLTGGSFYVGQQFGSQVAEPDIVLSQMKRELAVYKGELEVVEASVDENMNALAQRLAQTKAHIIRLDALGERLIEKAKLDKGEFDFDSEPSVGGPASARNERGENTGVSDFLNNLDDLGKKMDKSSFQLSILESMLMNRDLHDEVYPSGRPIKRGWISSYYGRRTDPFTGRRAHHDGIDLAGKKGSEVIAVASGIVTWAGKRYGYGNLVEINHGNGYVTRYGHNETIEVKIGDAVKKGQTISRMGSTGRSTGPHVHFEVHKNGRSVDPMKYVRASR